MGAPLYITTALIVGVFFGLLMSEGTVQLFQRLFSFDYAQYNVSEVRRGLKRIASLSVLLGAVMVAAIWLFGAFEGIPQQLELLTAVSALTIFGHRVSYVIVYAMKRYAQVVVSYAVALASLVTVYTLLYNVIPLTLNRYLVSLGTAVLVLSILPLYYAYRVFTVGSAYSLDDSSRNPFNTLSILRRTIASKFSVQLWRVSRTTSTGPSSSRCSSETVSCPGSSTPTTPPMGCRFRSSSILSITSAPTWLCW